MTEAEWLASDSPAAMLTWLRGSPLHEGANWSNSVRDYKLRLFACALCRHNWSVLSEDGKSAVLMGEQIANNLVGNAERLEKERHLPRPLNGAMLAASYCLWPQADYAARAALQVLLPNDCVPVAVRYAALLRDVVGNPWRPITLFVSGNGSREVSTNPSGDGPWWSLTPQVLSLARAAYDEPAGRKCEKCKGRGGCCDLKDAAESKWRDAHKCPTCDGTGHVLAEDGSLDPVRLAILADALEEAGCPAWERYQDDAGGPLPDFIRPHPLLAHLRSPGPHVRGCFVLGLILGEE